MPPMGSLLWLFASLDLKQHACHAIGQGVWGGGRSGPPVINGGGLVVVPCDRDARGECTGYRKA